MGLTTKLYEFYPAVAAVLTVEHDGRRNAMAMAWHTILSFNPPLFGLWSRPRAIPMTFWYRRGPMR